MIPQIDNNSTAAVAASDGDVYQPPPVVTWQPDQYTPTSSATQQLIHGLPPPTTVGSSVVQALNAVEHIEEVSASDDKEIGGRKVVVVGEDEDEAGNISDEGYRTHSSGMSAVFSGYLHFTGSSI